MHLSPMNKIRILFAEEYVIFRDALRHLIEAEDEFEVVGEASDGEELVKKALELRPDVILMDVVMPKINGIQATQQIKAALPTSTILILSSYKYEAYVVATLRAGAAGFLSKGAHGSQLISAIKAVRKGEPVVDETVAYRILTSLITTDTTNRRTVLDKVHVRELDVLRLAAKGLRNKDIAQRLSISESTVQTHFLNIFRKLDVASRTEAVVRALREGWLNIDDLS
jgi:NarL family two-component system response regulator LiaR